MLYKILNKIKFFLKRNNSKQTTVVPDIKPQNTRKIRQTSKYQKFRKKVKSTIPQECWNCDSKKGLQIHHIVSLSENEKLAIEMSNVIMLCKACHTQFHEDCTKILNGKSKPISKKKCVESSDAKLTRLYTQRKLLKFQVKELEYEIAEIEFEKARVFEAEEKYTSALKAYSKAKSFGKSPEYLHALRNIQKTVNQYTKEIDINKKI